MGNKRSWNDRAMKALLRGYRRPEEERPRFDAMFEAAAGDSRLIPLKRAPRLPPLGWAVAAAALLAILTGGVFLRGALSLDAPLATFAVAADGSVRAGTAARQGRLSAPAGSELRFRSSSETLAAAAGSEVSVGMDPWRAFTGRRGLTYRIESGGVYLIHGDGAAPFRLETPFGSIRPLGTALSLRLDGGTLDLACLRGTIAFKPEGGRGEIEILAGYRLSIEAGKGNASPVPRKMQDGEILPFAPAYPEAEELPVNAPLRWREAETPQGNQARRGDEASPAPARRTAPPSAEPRLRKAWSAPTGIAPGGGPKAARLEAQAGSIFLQDGSKLSGFDPLTGERLFRVDLGLEPEGFAAGQDAFLLSGAELTCRDGRTGSEKWKAKAGPISFGDIALSGKRVFVASADGKLYAFDAASGAALMKAEAGVGLYGTPTVAGERVVASGLDGILRGFPLEGKSIPWAYPTGERLSGDRPVALDASLVLDALPSGALVALDAASGAPRWKAALSGKPLHGAIALAGFAACEDGSGIRLVSAAGALGAPLQRLQGGLLAAVSRPGGAELATRGGIWRLDAGGKLEGMLLEAQIAAASPGGEAWFVWDGRGELSAWRAAR